MRAAILVGRETFEIGEAPTPTPGPGEVLVRSAWTGVCGTDLHVWHGQFEGRVAYPAILGHEFSGTVEALGDGVEGPAVGDRVTVEPLIPCRSCPACAGGATSGCERLKLNGIDLPGGLGEFVTVDARSVVKLPDGVSLRDGAAAEIFSIGLHASTRGQVLPGATVVVIGAGKVGHSIVAALAGTAGMLIAIDPRADRLERATTAGATHLLNPSEEDVVAAVKRIAPHGADRVFEAVGHWEEFPPQLPPVAQAVEMVRNAGRVIVLGQGPDATSIFFRPFIWKEAEIVASRVSRGEFPRAVEMIAAGRIDPDTIITHEMPVGDVQKAYEMLNEAPPGVLKVMLSMDW